ncbi:TapY2 family type IVa secretion system protein [Thalassotalea eurytherma]|uniref:Uncharacterized protein n=1 Tax=Thalassotalea eurytherma TaxID=1144278 RepID=A0ABQ6H111_9GAMM|nr:TapY2 family type IVa secretion system protein [Thalassotalea eurytherma]GLX81792.1 hypothetical protein theurythT_12440 [Thalassotalea eurytherma]
MNILKILVVAIPAFAFNVEAKEKQEMKCYVKDSSGIDNIYFVNAPKDKINALPKKLIGKTFDKGNIKKRRISEVVECVKASELFSDVIARQLDSVTVR